MKFKECIIEGNTLPKAGEKWEYQGDIIEIIKIITGFGYPIAEYQGPQNKPLKAKANDISRRGKRI